jgi:glycosyltransferase involved in cell wall biosynthesis
VTVASRTLESLVWAMGADPRRVVYLPNGVDTTLDDQRPTSNGTDSDRRPLPTMLLYTRFWELDMAELAAALAAIHTARPAARLLVVGRGENGEERELLALADRAGFAPMLDYRGWLEPAVIPATLAAARIALVPARDTLINRARCSAKLLELMGAGLAVIASDVGEARSFVQPERSGLLVPPGDPGALAAAALRLLDDAALRERLAAGAGAAAASFSWDHLAPLAEQAYQVAMAAG